MEYLHAFQNCTNFSDADGTISRGDMVSLCQKYALKFDSRQDPTPHNPRIKFETFKRCIKSHHDSPSSPLPRAGSGRRASRPSVHTPSSSYHHSRTPLKYVGSPGGHDRDHCSTDDYKRSTFRQERSRTPEYTLSPEEQRINRLPRDRPRPQHDDLVTNEHWTYPERDRGHVESPPPSSWGQRPPTRSHHGDDSEGSDNEGFPPSSSSASGRRTICKYCRKYGSTELQEKVRRLEKDNEGLTKELMAAQNTDLQFANLLRDNERLRQDLKKMNRAGPEHDIDSRILERKNEELQKKCEELEAEVRKRKDIISDLKGYRREYNSLRLKYETQQRDNWNMMSEIEQLRVKVMELESGALIGGRRPKSQSSSELGFVRSSTRKSCRELHSRSKKKPMKRTPSADPVLVYDEKPQKEQPTTPRALTHKSFSEESSLERLPLVTTTPDEQSQVFLVMEEEVNKSVLPDDLNGETELALIYALQNCHSPQEIIKCLVSYGVGTQGEKVQEFKVQNNYLNSRLEHLKAKNTMLANSFENAKSNMENMYSHAQKVESNNTRLLHALRYCCQACEVYDVLLELRIPDRRMSSLHPQYFDYSSLESSTRSLEREQHSSTSSTSGKPPAILRARNLLHSLDSDPELQKFLPGTRSHPNGTDFRSTVAMWGCSSQNTGTTSGLSSMSGGTEGDITLDEIERLRLYTQALITRKNHFTSTLAPTEGRKGLELVKEWELVKDCLPAGHGGQILDLEDAANAEELSKVREEKAELRSQIYMMEYEKQRMELEVARMLLHKKKIDRINAELQFQLEKRRKKRAKKDARRGDLPPPSSLDPHQHLSAQLQMALDRERELTKRYEDLFHFLARHTRESYTVSEDLMGFVRDMWRQNSKLVDAFEKSTKRQTSEKKRLQKEVLSLMNKVRHVNSAPTNEEPSSGVVYP